MTTSLPAWQPPPNFVLADSALPGISVFVPQAAAVQEDAPQTFKCPQCGAPTRFDVAVSGVACEHCGYGVTSQAEAVGFQAGVMEFTLDTLSRAEKGWGTTHKELHCDSCGADMAVPENALSVSCPFCASNHVNLREAPVDQLRPRYLIPFKIQPQATRALAQNWLGQGWYHPDGLGGSARVDRFSGIYLPFWTFSAQMTSAWKAQVGYERSESYYDPASKSWKTRMVIDWRWEKGQVDSDMSDLLVCGSSRVSQTLVKRLFPFRLEELVNYAPDFLAGWQAQTYDLTLPKAWEQGKADMREQARQACLKSIRSTHVRNFSMVTDFSQETWRYVLLPVYLTAYQFENKVYQVMLNGQTGTIAGQKPVAWWKVWLAVAAMLTPGLCLGLLGLPLLLAGGLGVLPLILGALALVAGLTGAFFLYRNAASSEAA